MQIKNRFLSLEERLNRLQLKGIYLALVATTTSAAFMIPWKLASRLGEASDMVLILIVVAATFNSLSIGLRKSWNAIFMPPNRCEFILATVFAIFTIVGNELSAQAIFLLSPAVATTIMRIEAVFIAILAWLFVKEAINIRFWIAILIVSFGFYTMQPPMSLDHLAWKGALYACSASLIFSLMAVATRKYIYEIDPAKVNSLRLWMSLALWPLMYQKVPDAGQWPLMFIFYVALAGFLGPGLGRLLIMYSARYIEARIGAMVVSGAPVMALVLSIVLLNDYPNKLEMIGGGLMMFGIFVSLTGQRRREPIIKMDPVKGVD